MKRSTFLVAIVSLVLMMLSSCSAPVVKTAEPVAETTVSTEMVMLETQAPTVTQDAPAASTQTQSATDDSTGMSEAPEVEIEDFAYVSASVTVKVGTTITWTNKDKVQHTVTSDTGLFDSGLFGKGESFSYTFTEAGTYAYHCTPHPNMKGTIIVE